MFRANEARELVNAEIKRLAEENTKRHEEWLNGEVSKKIKESATKGGTCASVTKPTNLDNTMIAKMLELNGYTVVFNNGLVKIKW